MTNRMIRAEQHLDSPMFHTAREINPRIFLLFCKYICVSLKKFQFSGDLVFSSVH